MSSSQQLLQAALILHRKPWRDTSLLIEAFSAEQGRIGLIAKGVRGKRSSRAALLQAFQPLLLSWSGRGELYTLTDAEPAAVMPHLQGNALVSGFYLNELLMRLLQRHDPHPRLFEAYRLALARLHTGEQIEWTLRLFECELLEQLGYGLSLDYCPWHDAPIEPGLEYVYLPERGPVPAGQAEGTVISGRTLLSLAEGQWPLDEAAPQLLREAKHLLRQTLASYLGPKPLASRALFQTMHSK